MKRFFSVFLIFALLFLCAGTDSIAANSLAKSASTNAGLITTNIPITADTTITEANLVGSGGYTISSGKTLTINGPFHAPAQQVFSGAGSVAFGAGAVSEVYPEWWGAAGDGTTDDSTEIQAAIDAASRIVFTGGKTYLCTTKITLPAYDREIVGNGLPVLTTTGSNAIFEATEHNHLYRFQKLKFTGGGTGIHYNMTESGSQYYEYEIENCIFACDAGVYGINLTGAREGHIRSCYFLTGNGLYSNKTVNTKISVCDFKNCAVGIYQNGEGSAYSAGILMDGITMLGCTEGVKISRGDWFSLKNSMIDYCTTPIQLIGQEGGIIDGCYISTTGTSTNPAIEMSTSTDQCKNIKIYNSSILGHSTDATFDCIKTGDTANTSIENCDIHFYTRYGISIGNTTKDTDLHIVNCKFSPRSGLGTNSIKTIDADDSSSWVMGCDINQAPSTTSVKYSKNIGWYTQLSGLASITSGNTSVTVTHGLSVTPTCVLVSPSKVLASFAKYGVTNITSTEFVITTDADPGETVNFYWQAKATALTLE